jgi:flagellar hook-length control protein FliK
MASEFTAGAQQKGGADAQIALSQAQLQNALASGSAANAFSSASDSRDNSSGKQDGSPGPMTSTAMSIGGQLQLDVPRAELQIGARVGSHVWRDEVAAKLTWMVDRGIQHGTLRLSPENLGPLEVRITTQNDQVSVWFGAAHADTRAALENALPRLREMFAAQGMSLADAGVFREPPKDTPHGYTASHGGAAIEGVEERSFAVSVRDGLLDAYA